MSTFRYKPKKTYASGKNITTLGTEHQKKEHYFANMKESLPDKTLEYEKLKKELKKLEEKNASKYTDADIKRKALLKDKIYDLEKEINKIENNVEEMNYYSKTFDILLDYYDDTENESEQKPAMAESIMDFFTKPQADKKNTEKRGKNKASLLDNYKTLVDDTYISNNKSYSFVKYCRQCNIEKILNQSEGIYECTNCGETELAIVESDRPNYKDPVPDNSAYAYKRINHQRINSIKKKFNILVVFQVVNSKLPILV